MPITLDPPKLEAPPRIDNRGPEPPPPALRDGGDGGGKSPAGESRYRLGVWIGLASVVMVFTAFTSSLVVRKGLSNDWVSIQFPALMYVNTLVLIFSSATLELAKHSLRRDNRPAFLRWWTTTTLLGAGFLAGQVLVWKQLAAAGIFLSSNPSSSFFYLLTAAHGVHLVGGILALLGILIAAARRRITARRRDPAEAAAIYWHFMDGLWVYLFVLLLVWR